MNSWSKFYMIDLVDVSKSYGPGLPAVNHANLHIDKGELYSL